MGGRLSRPIAGEDSALWGDLSQSRILEVNLFIIAQQGKGRTEVYRSCARTLERGPEKKSGQHLQEVWGTLGKLTERR